MTVTTGTVIADVAERDTADRATRVREAVIETLADAEAAWRAHARLQVAIVLDIVDRQRREIERLKKEKNELRQEIARYTATMVHGSRVA